MKYRPEIDGLRALAVLPVILFHAGFESFSGGFVGVDVFFVISGYLITTILIEDIENQRFSIINFYERRARRILPALFFVMLACIPFAWVFMLPSQMTDFAQSLVATSLFASNILFWRESGYFAAAAEEKPLLHTWSLAVEEQYYLFFPVFLIFAWRFGKNRVFWIIVFMSAISLLLSEWLWRLEATANFYLAPTRAWEIFFGSISAFLVQKYGVQKNSFLSLIGLLAVLSSILIYDKNVPFPSAYTLVPVLGVVLIILFADQRTIVSKILSLKLFIGVGLISYSAYLWHQPLFAFARIAMPTYPSDILFFFLSLMSLGIGYLSWKYIEAPFRNRVVVKEKLLWIISAAFIAIPLILGLILMKSDNFFREAWVQKSTPSEVHALNLFEEAKANQNYAFSKLNSNGITSCQFFGVSEDIEDKNDFISSIQACSKKYGKGIILLGDSHSLDIFNILVNQESYPFIINLRQIGCKPEKSLNGCNLSILQHLLKEESDKLEKLIFVNAGFWNLINERGAEVTRSDFAKLASTEIVRFSPNIPRIVSTVNYLTMYSKFLDITWLAPRAEPHIDLGMFLKKGCDSHWKYRPNQVETFRGIEEVIKKENESQGSALKIKSQINMLNLDLAEDFSDCKSLFWTDSDHFSAYGEIRFSNRIKL